MLLLSRFFKRPWDSLKSANYLADTLPHYLFWVAPDAEFSMRYMYHMKPTHGPGWGGLSWSAARSRAGCARPLWSRQPLIAAVWPVPMPRGRPIGAAIQPVSGFGFWRYHGRRIGPGLLPGWPDAGLAWVAGGPAAAEPLAIRAVSPWSRAKDLIRTQASDRWRRGPAWRIAPSRYPRRPASQGSVRRALHRSRRLVCRCSDRFRSNLRASSAQASRRPPHR